MRSCLKVALGLLGFLAPIVPASTALAGTGSMLWFYANPGSTTGARPKFAINGSALAHINQDIYTCSTVYIHSFRVACDVAPGAGKSFVYSIQAIDPTHAVTYIPTAVCSIANAKTQCKVEAADQYPSGTWLTLKSETTTGAASANCWGTAEVLEAGAVGPHDAILVSAAQLLESPTFPSYCGPGSLAGQKCNESLQERASWLMPNSATIACLGIHRDNTVSAGQTESFTVAIEGTNTNTNCSVSGLTTQDCNATAPTPAPTIANLGNLTVKASRTGIGSQQDNRNIVVEISGSGQPVNMQGTFSTATRYFAPYGVASSTIAGATWRLPFGPSAANHLRVKTSAPVTAAVDAILYTAADADPAPTLLPSTFKCHIDIGGSSCDRDIAFPLDKDTWVSMQVTGQGVTSAHYIKIAYELEPPPTFTPSATATISPTFTFTASPTSSVTYTPTKTPTDTPTPTNTPIPTDTPSLTPTNSATPTPPTGCSDSVFTPIGFNSATSADSITYPPDISSPSCSPTTAVCRNWNAGIGRFLIENSGFVFSTQLLPLGDVITSAWLRVEPTFVIGANGLSLVGDYLPSVPTGCSYMTTLAPDSALSIADCGSDCALTTLASLGTHNLTMSNTNQMGRITTGTILRLSLSEITPPTGLNQIEMSDNTSLVVRHCPGPPTPTPLPLGTTSHSWGCPNCRRKGHNHD